MERTDSDLVLQGPFRHDYDVQILEQLPDGYDSIQVFPSSEFRNCLCKKTILISPRFGKPWIGQFAGYKADAGVTGIYTCPNPEQVCVIIGGSAHIANVNGSSDRIETPIDFVLRIDSSLEQNIMVFSTDPFLWAWGEKGLLWEIYDMADSDLRIREIRVNSILGTAIKENQTVEFEIETSTGRYSIRKQGQ